MEFKAWGSSWRTFFGLKFWVLVQISWLQGWGCKVYSKNGANQQTTVGACILWEIPRRLFVFSPMAHVFWSKEPLVDIHVRSHFPQVYVATIARQSESVSGGMTLDFKNILMYHHIPVFQLIVVSCFAVSKIAPWPGQLGTKACSGLLGCCWSSCIWLRCRQHQNFKENLPKL